MKIDAGLGIIWGLLFLGVPLLENWGKLTPNYLGVYVAATGALLSYAMLERFMFQKRPKQGKLHYYKYDDFFLIERPPDDDEESC